MFLPSFYIHLYFASDIVFLTYPHMHIRVRINLSAKSRYWYFPLLKMKSRHSFPSLSFPCLYCVFHIHFGIKQWDSRCCTGTLTLTLKLKPFSQDVAHQYSCWQFATIDLLLLGSMIQTVMEEKGRWTMHRWWNIHSSPWLLVSTGTGFWQPCSAQRDRSTQWPIHLQDLCSMLTSCSATSVHKYDRKSTTLVFK